ncbi:hypothetical protein GCM10020366_23000 [Saccharopolyspora gregorii]|uniref:Uncharacterized protein n=1 Tax=Saccharopolyspora gregorii TaxID=33914 RepID=A0ABP6RM52_9PSEU
MVSAVVRIRPAVPVRAARAAPVRGRAAGNRRAVPVVARAWPAGVVALVRCRRVVRSVAVVRVPLAGEVARAREHLAAVPVRTVSLIRNR